MTAITVPTFDHRSGVGSIADALDEDGVVVITGLLPIDHIDRLRAALRELVLSEAQAESAVPPPLSRRVGELIVKHPVFRAPLVHPLVLAVWRHVLGEDMICSTWTGNTIMPGGGGMDWHVDHPFWATRAPFPTGCCLAGQTIWMLDDFTDANGATAVVPRSHRRTYPPSANDQWYDDAFIVEAPAGSVVMANALVWHSPRPNRSPAARHALLGMYVRSLVKPMEDMRCQLACLSSPSDEERQVLGEHAYRSRTLVTGGRAQTEGR